MISVRRFNRNFRSAGPIGDSMSQSCNAYKYLRLSSRVTLDLFTQFLCKVLIFECEIFMLIGLRAEHHLSMAWCTHTVMLMSNKGPTVHCNADEQQVHRNKVLFSAVGSSLCSALYFDILAQLLALLRESYLRVP